MTHSISQYFLTVIEDGKEKILDYAGIRGNHPIYNTTPDPGRAEKFFSRETAQAKKQWIEATLGLETYINAKI